MGQLYDTVQKLEAVIQAKGLDPFKSRGSVVLKAGFTLGGILPTTPDDPAKLQKLKAAAKAALGVDL